MVVQYTVLCVRHGTAFQWDLLGTSIASPGQTPRLLITARTVAAPSHLAPRQPLVSASSTSLTVRGALTAPPRLSTTAHSQTAFAYSAYYATATAAKAATAALVTLATLAASTAASTAATAAAATSAFARASGRAHAPEAAAAASPSFEARRCLIKRRSEGSWSSGFSRI